MCVYSFGAFDVLAVALTTISMANAWRSQTVLEDWRGRHGSASFLLRFLHDRLVNVLCL